MLHGAIKYSLLSSIVKELYNLFCCSLPNKYILLKYFLLKINVSCHCFSLILKWHKWNRLKDFSKDMFISRISFGLNLKRLPLVNHCFKATICNFLCLPPYRGQDFRVKSLITKCILYSWDHTDHSMEKHVMQYCLKYYAGEKVIWKSLFKIKSPGDHTLLLLSSP